MNNYPRVNISVASELYQARISLREGAIGQHEYRSQMNALLYACKTEKDYESIMKEVMDLEYKMITGYC